MNCESVWKEIIGKQKNWELGKEREQNLAEPELWLSAMKPGGDKGYHGESKWVDGRGLGFEVIQAEQRALSPYRTGKGRCSALPGRLNKDQQRPFPFGRCTFLMLLGLW